MDPRTDPLQFALLNRWQRDFPLCEAPFDVLAGQLGVTPETVLAACERLVASGAISRIGAVFGIGAGGASLLAAMAVPPADLAAVAARVSALPGVNHNYERDNRFNLWFVLTGRDETSLAEQLAALERDSGLPVLRLPMLQPYGVDLAFDLRREPSQAPRPMHEQGRAWRAGVPPVADADRSLAALLERGLPLQRRPFDAWARELALTASGAGRTGAHDSAGILRTLGRWLDAGTLNRFGVIVRHHELGYRANAMTVFDVPDAVVDRCGHLLAGMPAVTLAYRRARAPGWPYNLYCMIHGASHDVVLAEVAEAAEGAGLAPYPREVLFSLRRFKQVGGRRFGDAALLPSAPGRPASGRPASGDAMPQVRPPRAGLPTEGHHAQP